MQKGFIFDSNKCTGCNACQIACSLENDVEFPLNWRQVNTFNAMRHPDIPHFHLSMACNHCFDPPCMIYCPALAFSKDPSTGAVNIDQKKCIGCQYCSWVCPYDAPQFNPLSRVIEKCTFCSHRLEDNLLPACVALCPTNALQFDDIEQSMVDKISGFTHSDIKPAIKIIPLKKNQRLPEMADLPFDQSIVNSFRDSLSKLPLRKKITCFAEWPLVMFSLLTASVISLLTADLLTSVNQSSLIYLIIALAGLGITTIHLGKVFRAPRAVLNWRESWISREILFYTTFLIFLFLFGFVLKDALWLGWLATLAGFLTLYSIDKIYSIIPTVLRQRSHSSNILLTGLFFASVFSEFIFGIIIFGGIKFLLYTARFLFRKNKTTIQTLRGVLRLLCGFILPMFLWSSQLIDNSWYIYPMIIFAEFVDRCEFYDELEILTPAGQMLVDLEYELDR